LLIDNKKQRNKIDELGLPFVMLNEFGILSFFLCNKNKIRFITIISKTLILE